MCLNNTNQSYQNDVAKQAANQQGLSQSGTAGSTFTFKQNFQGVCPHCGYCPHCGQHRQPYNQYGPYWSIQNPQYTHTVTGLGETTTSSPKTATGV